MDNQESSIGQFYNDKSVFITGATGFMGKVLVEKLLRSTNVKKIYLLIRPKKGIQTKVRLEELMSAKLFDELKQSSSDVMSRVEAIAGDITEPNFGLSDSDERTLVEEVNVVFHSAATIKFDEDLTDAVNLNVVAVFTIIEICKKMKNLQALIHVSTQYCNPQLKHIPEEIIHSNGDAVGIVDMCKRMDASLLNSREMTKKIIGNKPNTYTFTKALGEAALVAEGGCLPIGIVRPSIVAAAWREPLPGWIEGLAGTTGIIAGIGKGLLRSSFCKSHMIADLVPVDVAINLFIAVAWKIASQPSNAIPVYNCGSSSDNPISWDRLEILTVEKMRKYPLENVLWYPANRTQKGSAWVQKFCEVTQHTAPAYMMDTVASLIGQKPIMRRAVEKMHKALRTVEFFATHEWRWSHDNMKKLHMELTEVDKKNFNFDLSALNWTHFMDDYAKGTKQHVFKEDLSTLTTSRRHLNKMFWIEKCLQMMLFIFFAKMLTMLFW